MTVPRPFTPADTSARHWRFLLLFALANAGGTIGYLPLFTVFLPMKVEAVAGVDRLNLFTLVALIGTLAAIGANLGFGWLSDRSVARGHGRRRWLLLGIVGLALSYALFARATSPLGVLLAVVAVQCAANAVLAPLLALMADEIPDAQKGFTGGLLALANPIGAATAWALVKLPGLSETGRLCLLSLAIALLIVPLAFSTARRLPTHAAPIPRAVARRNLAVAWIARLLLQSAGNGLTLYLYYYFADLPPRQAAIDAADFVSRTLVLAYLLPLPCTLLLGRLSDRIGRRKPFLLGAAAVTAGGLAVMALAATRPVAVAGFLVYGVGAQVFMALHGAFWMQELPSERHRGRDLGILNLTNTLPALIGTAVAWLAAMPGSFAPLLFLLSGLTFAGGLVMLMVREPAPAGQG
ncbi:MFS transporter [Sphingomonas echinoides]|uniref:MFS transporter n=1 Tax=Sphingomonas echinoides TaxID=59803 RepID=A0ABU4PJN9_9SPHN|nr:MFS transporter [Sphingomonas echinoides]MDX5984386.1 MFS transporter [Sphingomonas echinoides]